MARENYALKRLSMYHIQAKGKRISAYIADVTVRNGENNLYNRKQIYIHTVVDKKVKLSL
jgi:hypothetical protein